MGQYCLPRQQADGRIYRQRRRANAAPGEILANRRGRGMPAGWTALRSASVKAPALAILLGLLLPAQALALAFPLLTGRVVDQASIIPTETRRAIVAKSEELE